MSLSLLSFWFLPGILSNKLQVSVLTWMTPKENTAHRLHLAGRYMFYEAYRVNNCKMSYKNSSIRISQKTKKFGLQNLESCRIAAHFFFIFKIFIYLDKQKFYIFRLYSVMLPQKHTLLNDYHNGASAGRASTAGAAFPTSNGTNISIISYIYVLCVCVCVCVRVRVCVCLVRTFEIYFIFS